MKQLDADGRLAQLGIEPVVEAPRQFADYAAKYVARNAELLTTVSEALAALEAVRCLQDEVIADPRDGNVAAVLGIGYPAQRGGPFRHLAARGLASTRARLAALAEAAGLSTTEPRRDLAGIPRVVVGHAG